MTEGRERKLDEADDAMPWGGRFAAPPSDGLLDFSRSVQTDMEMWREDLAGSRAHVRALESAGILTRVEADQLWQGLDSVAAEFESDVFEVVDTDEDIHMAIERRLTELVGEVGGKLHSGRSRNDQVSLDVRLVSARRGRAAALALLDLASTLVERASTAGDLMISGYTHLQRAQPVLLAHHLLAHVWPLLRDVERLKDAGGRSMTSPLGAGALAGTSLPVDPQIAAAELGIPKTFENSIDAVADRDVVAEHLAVLAIAQVHLSRLAEEVVIWATDEFGFITLADAWSTGSSMMPQKKNPDVAELTRGRTGRTIGNLVSVLTMLKGLPLAYNRDLQEDKRPLFDSFDVVSASAAAMSGMVSTLTFNEAALAESVDTGFCTATDLAEELVGLGMPFRGAHEAVGKLVVLLESEGRGLVDVTNAELVDIHPGLADLGQDRLSSREAIERRGAVGATSRRAVDAQIVEASVAIEAQIVWATES